MGKQLLIKSFSVVGIAACLGLAGFRQIRLDQYAPSAEFSKSVRSKVTKDETLFVNGTADDLALKNACFPLNSQEWLKGPRYANNDNGMSDDFVRQMILDTPYSLAKILEKSSTFSLDRSLCLDKSRFRNVSIEVNDHDEELIRLWAVRLSYLALHYHQHYPAISEARHRLKTLQGESKCSDHSTTVGRFDYECKGAKFMIVPMKGHGLGANLRTDVTPAIMVGLITNRTVLFVNNLPIGKQDVRYSWDLASCPRRDFQCFFLPSSPCVLTSDDISNAHVFEDRVHFRRIIKKGIWPEGFDDVKVWLFRHASGHSEILNRIATRRLQNYSQILLENAQLTPGDPKLPLLQKAIEAIGMSDPSQPGYGYAMKNMKVHHACEIYTMRPNPITAQKLNGIHHDIVENSQNTINPEHTLGLPVRGSDKCRRESECLSFEEHVMVGSEAWTRFGNNATVVNNISVTVIFTTESKHVVQEQESFASNRTLLDRYPHKFKFVHNTHDVTPDTGYIKHVEIKEDEETFSADDAMLSAISSFQAQLLARTTVGNCCSHFHHLLNDFLMEGCGAAKKNTFMCMQDSLNPSLVPCCSWRPDCKRKKKELS